MAAFLQSMLDILYEDNHLIAVRKPHGMLVQGDETGDPSLINEVRYFIKQRDNKPGNVFVGLLHRLDRPVGGVVLFGKTSKGAARLSEQFRKHEVEKIYWAVVQSEVHPPFVVADDRTASTSSVRTDSALRREGTITQWLVKNENANMVTAHDREVPGSLYAETSYRVVAERDGKALVELKPKTGRPHQLRVAMASLGAPIVGDVKYGAKQAIALASGSTALALFARSLTFDQPVTKERITVTAEPELDIFNYA